MIVQQKAPSVDRLMWSFTPAPLAALVGGALLAGGIIGAALTWQQDRLIASESANAAGSQVSFDAVQFRAEERARFATPQVSFDAVQFRAEERAPLAP